MCHLVAGLEKWQNVGTVLFTEADNYRHCWDDEQLALLQSRMFFEDLLPNEEYFDIRNDDFILALIEYYKLIIDNVKTAVEGKTKNILLRSLSDSLGKTMLKLFLTFLLDILISFCGNFSIPNCTYKL